MFAFLKPAKLRRFQVGPLGLYIEGFAAVLSQRDYNSRTIREKLRIAADLSRWLERRHIKLNRLKERHIHAYLQARRKRVYRGRKKLTVIALLQHLRKSQAVPTVPTPAHIVLIEQEYRGFLTQERGLTESSVKQYLSTAQRFFAHRFQSGKVRLNQLCAKDVTNFVLHYRSRRSPSPQWMITRLRSFLRFLFQHSWITTNLAAAVPTVPKFRLSELPRFLETKQVEKVLRCCDRRTKMGKRDYAILLLLARLGIRGGEVAQLTLDDIDWHAGELLIRGKGNRIDKLPLLQEIGQAVVDYLQKARPDCPSRHVFIRCNAKHVGFRGPAAISQIVRRALALAHIQTFYQAAHLFRHSLATKMLGHGASLAQIGQVLRHQHVSSTEIYAKVNLNALRRLALPWLGGSL